MTSLARGVVQGFRTLIDKTPVPYVGQRENRTQYGSSRARGGPSVDELSATEAVSTLFAIVGMEAQSVSRYDWTLYRKARSGKKEDRTAITTAHPATVVWNRPNDFMTRQELMETVQQHVELTGLGYVVAARAVGDMITELWPVRPDRIVPVKSPTEFIVGYVYLGPDGEQVPLETRDVYVLRSPHPMDLYQGLSPVRSLMTDLSASDMASEWNKNFFRNSAEPGGVIEYEDELDPDQYRTLVQRWREQHQGVGNAHRVAIIERGKWVPRVYSRRDMEFTSMRADMREIIREAFAFPKILLGAGEDSNRATAEALEYIFGKWHVSPRLDRWKGMLNNDFLPAMGIDTDQYEFDYPYDEVVPANRELDDRELATRANAAKTLVEAGWGDVAVLETVGLPPMPYSKPEPTAVGAPGVPGGMPAPDSGASNSLTLPIPQRGRAYLTPVRAAAEDVDAIDLSEVDDDYQAVLATLMADWEGVSAEQRAELTRQVQEIIASGQLDRLSELQAPSADGSAVLLAAMLSLAALAAVQVVREAGRQGVSELEITATIPARSTFRKIADAVSGLLAAGMALTAGREALRAQGDGVTPAAVADRVRVALAELSDATPRGTLGAALNGAQNMARVETLRTGPEGAIYASEQLDGNTCKPCREVHGRWLGNISDMDMITQTYPQGAFGGYIGCLGRERCRGTVVGVWRPKQVRG